MDPNATLRDIDALVAEIQRCVDLDERDAAVSAWNDLTDRLRALDNWLQGGGFLPSRWQRNVPEVNVRNQDATTVVGAVNELVRAVRDLAPAR